MVGDITTIGDTIFDEPFAIVNAANRRMLGGGGVDGAIHEAGGPEIYNECLHLRHTVIPAGLDAGAAVATTAGNMSAHAVIHTVGPVYDPKLDLSEILQDCYRRSIFVAEGLGVANVAFPLISSGVYGWPKEDAVIQALEGISLAETKIVKHVALVAFNHIIGDVMQDVVKKKIG